jgi:hypothetical protein
VNQSGFVERFMRPIQNNNWTSIYSAPRDLCDNYSVCGAHMICKMVDQSHNCTCLEGFEPKSHTDWSRGCARRSALNCTHGIFQNFTGLKLPDTSLSWYDTSMSLVECKDMCLKNCSCTAYANSNITGEASGCILWFGELVDMREFSTGGQDLYIRMPPPLKTGIYQYSFHDSQAGYFFSLFFSVCFFYFWNDEVVCSLNVFQTSCPHFLILFTNKTELLSVFIVGFQIKLRQTQILVRRSLWESYSVPQSLLECLW